jgi:primosomal protein N' (replication factor Y)
VPCVLVSACPTLEQLGWGRLVLPPRRVEREGWPPLQILDRRDDDPRSGLYSPRMVEYLRSATSGQRAVCVLNRKGRARLLACGVCQAVARCEVCGAGVALGSDPARLTCPRCGTERPPVCTVCGASRLRARRVGVTRAREELEALAGQSVGEVTAETAGLPDTAVLVGTEAVLHRVQSVGGVGTVVFLDFDSELLAARYRAGEQALALLARAARLVGGRRGGGRLVVQTRVPDHPAVEAARRADPSLFAAPEAAIRASVCLPPATAIAELSGAGAADVVAALQTLGAPLELLGPSEGRWLVRAADHDVLCNALAAVPPGSQRVRIDVDPLRV